MKIGAVMFFTSDSMQPAELGIELEQRGFESLWVPEHTHIPLTRRTSPPSGGPLIRPYFEIYDPFVALSTAAAVTKNLKIGTGVCLIPQRDPIVTAKLVSSLDRVSNGGSCSAWATVGTRTKSRTTAPCSRHATSSAASGSRR